MSNDDSIISDEIIDKITPYLLCGLALLTLMILVVCLFIQAKRNKPIVKIPNVKYYKNTLSSTQPPAKRKKIIYFGNTKSSTIFNKETFKNPDNIKKYKLSKHPGKQEKEFIDFLFDIHNKKSLNTNYWKNYFSNPYQNTEKNWKGFNKKTNTSWKLLSSITHLDTILLHSFFKKLAQNNKEELTYFEWNTTYKKMSFFKKRKKNCSSSIINNFYAKLYPKETFGYFPEQDDINLYSNLINKKISSQKERLRFDKYGRLLVSDFITQNDIPSSYETAFQPTNNKNYKPIKDRNSRPFKFNCQRPWFECHSQSFLPSHTH